MKTYLTAAVIALLLPATGFAQCNSAKQITASSCKDGMTWDQAKGECVLSPTT
jgi:hypothetical protein